MGNKMKNLLKINSSIFSDQGQSSRLAEQFTAAWQAVHPEGKVKVKDLANNPIPHLTSERFLSFLAKPEERTVAQKEVVEFSDALIEEIKQADVIVIGLPMYNLGVPSTLKSYFDHIARAGVTFRYTEKGPQGLIKDKKVYVFASRGGLYAGTALDTQTSYVKDFLRLIGIEQVEFIYAEGLSMGDASKQNALTIAQEKIAQLAQPAQPLGTAA